MTLWDFIDRIIRNPPAWIMVVLVAIIVSHVLDKVVGIVSGDKMRSYLVPIVELILVSVLAYVALHLYYERSLSKGFRGEWTGEPLLIMFMFCVFGLISVVLYIIYRVAVPHDEP